MVHNNLARLVGDKVNLLLRFTSEDGLCTLSCRFLDAYHAENCVLLSAKNRVVLFTVHIAGSEKEDLACRGEEVVPTNDGSIATLAAGLNVEIEKLREQLAHERLRSEALQTIIEVAELDLGLDIRKKRLPQQ